MEVQQRINMNFAFKSSRMSQKRQMVAVKGLYSRRSVKNRAGLEWKPDWSSLQKAPCQKEQHSRPDALHSTLKVFMDGFDIHSNSFCILSEVMPSTYRNHKHTQNDQTDLVYIITCFWISLPDTVKKSTRHSLIIL